MGEIFSDFFLFFVLIKNGAAEVVERAVSCRRRSVRVCARARLRELLRAGGWQLRATATATATRRLGSGGGGPGVSVPSWPGPAVAAWRGLWLRPLAPWRLRPARAAAGCKAGAAAAPVRGGFLFRFFLFFFLACGSGSGSGRGRESSRMVVSSPGLARAGKLGGVRHAGGPPRSAGQADDRGRRVVSTCFSRFFLSRKKTKGRNWNLEENCSSCHVAS